MIKAEPPAGHDERLRHLLQDPPKHTGVQRIVICFCRTRPKHTASHAAKNCSGNGNIEPLGSSFILRTECLLHLFASTASSSKHSSPPRDSSRFSPFVFWHQTRKGGRLEARREPNLDGKSAREDEPATLDLYSRLEFYFAVTIPLCAAHVPMSRFWMAAAIRSGNWSGVQAKLGMHMAARAEAWAP
jgi:hypothetical protein